MVLPLSSFFSLPIASVTGSADGSRLGAKNLICHLPLIFLARTSEILGLKNKLNNPYKCISQSPNLFSKYYNYKLQTGNADSSYKTFKGGEMYRFGIQLQSAKGQWTSILWLGDKECTTYPMVDNVNHQISLNNAIYVMPKALKDACVSAGFSNYRIVIADPENQNGRRVQAQGVVCPTLFSPGQRAMGIHSISSWIMRPKGMDCSHHHFEPITSSLAEKGGEIMAALTYVWNDRKRYFGLPLSFTRYALSGDRLFISVGFLNIKDDEILLYRVRDIDTSRSLVRVDGQEVILTDIEYRILLLLASVAGMIWMASRSPKTKNED